MRTRERLGDALIALMHERNFDDITVKDVLDRAGVSRSTFFVHYSDKDDLFLSDVEDFLENVSTALKRQGANPKRLLPVQEFLAHIRDARELYAAFVKSGKIHDFRALGRAYLRARSKNDCKCPLCHWIRFRDLPTPMLLPEVSSRCSTSGSTKEWKPIPKKWTICSMAWNSRTGRSLIPKNLVKGDWAI
jgi:AcrR family transcriptional regulator